MVLTFAANYYTNKEMKLFTRYSLLPNRYSLRFIRTVLHYIHNVYIKLHGSS